MNILHSIGALAIGIVAAATAIPVCTSLSFTGITALAGAALVVGIIG